jgi:membrane protein implicated in regulation of membrane protease activity
MEAGNKVYALLWLPLAILLIFVAITFLPIFLSVLGSYFYIAYIIIGLIVFFSFYVFYKKLKGE